MMVRRRGEKRPDMPGGAAAERLRMFEEARHPATTETKPSHRTAGKPAGARKTGGGQNAKQKGKEP